LPSAGEQLDPFQHDLVAAVDPQPVLETIRGSRKNEVDFCELSVVWLDLARHEVVSRQTSIVRPDIDKRESLP
jgi:hypothetical protein